MKSRYYFKRLLNCLYVRMLFKCFKKFDRCNLSGPDFSGRSHHQNIMPPAAIPQHRKKNPRLSAGIFIFFNPTFIP